MSWLECVPNVSEGRDLDWVSRVVRRLDAFAEVHVLDRTSDADHHRSVLTLVGRSGQLEEAVIELARAAVDQIDLRRQSGVHPRVGALDVAPFVPLGETPMSTAVAAAHRTGVAIAAELGVPVFAYGRAARSPERERLEAIRRGGLDGLGERMATERRSWSPDWGPPRPHATAGATVVGARDFLLAFNVLLDTDDVALARRVARAVRESGGGLRTVKAIGVPLTARRAAQVSLNLTDFRAVSPRLAFAHVRKEARRLGAEVIASERIGLFPRAALGDGDAEEILLENPDPLGSLDDRLERIGIRAGIV